MASGWRYRIVSVLGTALIAAIAVTVANLSLVQETFALVPYFGRPAPAVLANDAFVWALSTTLVVVLASMWPLFKPRPRRILDTILLTQKRILLAMVALAALGYFNYSYRLPRATLMLSTAVLLVLLPLFTVAVRRRPRSSAGAVVIGDDLQTMQDTYDAFEGTVHGLVAPPSLVDGTGEATDYVRDADTYAVTELPTLGGFARLDEVLVKYDVDTALLAFDETDREEFFGTLEACHEHGITAVVHADHADHVLTAEYAGSDLLRVDLEPLDWQEYALKRLFDIAFAGLALLALSPVVVTIAVAIKLEDGGSVLYSQERTAAFGSTFTIFKFRSMTPAPESTDPGDDEGERVTRVGRFLRKTHLDEIPQLWTILTGKMSVVGPRAVWTDEEVHLEAATNAWRKRWFIKPGLTGLAQVNEADSADATAKLRYDLEYIRRQSFWFDLKIVVRELWDVGGDAIGFLLARPGENGAGDVGETEETTGDQLRTGDAGGPEAGEGAETAEVHSQD